MEQAQAVADCRVDTDLGQAQLHLQRGILDVALSTTCKSDLGLRGLLCESDLELVGLDEVPHRLHDTQEFAVVALHPLPNVAALDLHNSQKLPSDSADMMTCASKAVPPAICNPIN